MKDERVFKFLEKCNRHHNTPDLHSFMAKTKAGFVWVDCKGHGNYLIELYSHTAMGEVKTSKIVSTTIAAAKCLEMLGIDFDSIEM